jgi:hypothetical protein
MATQWIGRAYIAMPVSAINATLRNNIANAFVNNGSMETNINERKLFDAVTRLSASGSLPATAVTIGTPIKAAMRDELAALVEAVPSARVMVVNADTFAVIRTNVSGVSVGTVVTWNQWITGLFNRYGLIVIQESTL